VSLIALYRDVKTTPLRTEVGRWYVSDRLFAARARGRNIGRRSRN
jgi:hypothetical protein